MLFMKRQKCLDETIDKDIKEIGIREMSRRSGLTPGYISRLVSGGDVATEKTHDLLLKLAKEALSEEGK